MTYDRDDILKGLSNIRYEDDPDFLEGTFDKSRMGILTNLVEYSFKKSKTYYMQENSSRIKHYINKLCKYQTVWDLEDIQEGEVIYAMYLAGFEVKRKGDRAYFKITSASCHKLYSEANTAEHEFHENQLLNNVNRHL